MTAQELEELRQRCVDLTIRLNMSEARLRDRSQLLYELQQHYASEHFALQESLRDLQTERFRNAGLEGQMKITRDRAHDLQVRIHALKVRLRIHEQVDDEYFDTVPIERRNPEDAQ